MKDAHSIIKSPVLTEKTYDNIPLKKYVFEVDVNAHKTEIKEAVETIFPGVKVDKVNTVRTDGKLKRQGRTMGRTPEVKKAYVTLKQDSKAIEFFESMVQ